MCEFCRWYVQEHGSEATEDLISNNAPQLDPVPVETDDDGNDSDHWFEQRYWDALYADHEKGHPNRDTPGPVKGCPDCENP